MLVTSISAALFWSQYQDYQATKALDQVMANYAETPDAFNKAQA
jgi:hypothetical protein